MRAFTSGNVVFVPMVSVVPVVMAITLIDMLLRSMYEKNIDKNIRIPIHKRVGILTENICIKITFYLQDIFSICKFM